MMAIQSKTIPELESRLNDFKPGVRRKALEALRALTRQGELDVNIETEVVNMHCHTFFSFNAYGFSPSALAWLGRKQGYKIMGIVDFDVLDGVSEFLDACDLIEQRGSAGMETRVFIPEFATREINSPGEPGVYYHMGIGFTSSNAPDEARVILDDMRSRAALRNNTMVERLNAHLSPVTIDYDQDVLPLTPGGTATERHILLAYKQAAEISVDDPYTFWAKKMDVPVEKTMMMKDDWPSFQNLMRSRLMKRGGIGYVQPDAGAFPSWEDFHKMVLACQALPCAAWLDGLSAGEQAIEGLLDLLISKGVAALNVVPDRNWNISDPETRRIKIQHLYDIVKIAQDHDLPLNVGTEMNAPGQKFVDDFNTPELSPVRQALIDGAYFIYGHTVMQRVLSMGFQSEWAKAFLPVRRQRNAFNSAIGKLAPPGAATRTILRNIPRGYSPNDVLAVLSKTFS
jgi:hypothetical protein